jgi:hypothetical protein
MAKRNPLKTSVLEQIPIFSVDFEQVKSPRVVHPTETLTAGRDGRKTKATPQD